MAPSQKNTKSRAFIIDNIIVASIDTPPASTKVGEVIVLVPVPPVWLAVPSKHSAVHAAGVENFYRFINLNKTSISRERPLCERLHCVAPAFAG